MNQDLKLLISINNNFFSYSIFNIVQNCFETIKSYKLEEEEAHLQIKDIINTNVDLKKNYTVTLSVIDGNMSTFIPEALFDKNNIKKYIEITYGNTDENHQYIKQKFLDCYNVFTIENNLLHTLEQKFKNLHIKSFGSLFVDYAIHLNSLNNQNLFAQINENNFHLTLISNRELKFYNKFDFQDKTDFTYYFMNCMQVLKFENQISKLLIISELEKNHPLFHILTQYLDLSFLDRPSNFLYKDRIMQDSHYKNHNLFSQLICE